jgi:Ca-activated chloride channel family protein
MRPDVKVSSKFITSQNSHQIGLLIELSADQPPRRAPINVALVLDRSGSMAGRPLEAAKHAATRFAELLGQNDRLSITVFDDDVATIFGPAPGGDHGARDAIARVQSGGTTNLSGGWLKGREHVEADLVEGTNRVVLFTDGMANRGLTEIPELVGLARGAAGQQVTTSCIGFGADFNEDLLREMSRAGGGNYWYIEAHDLMADIFGEEIEGLVALAAQNVTLTIRLTHPQIAGVSFLQRFPTQRADDGTWTVTLGDLYATSPKSLGTLFHVENVADLGPAQVAEVRLAADVVTAEGVEHQVITLPISANLDGADHVDPTVERTLIRFEAARAREDAMQQADAGDLDAAAQTLAAASAKLEPHRADPKIAEEIDDLRVESERLRSREYGARDRKYHEARQHAIWENKDAYLKKMSRKPQKPREP